MAFLHSNVVWPVWCFTLSDADAEYINKLNVCPPLERWSQKSVTYVITIKLSLKSSSRSSNSGHLVFRVVTHSDKLIQKFH